MAVAAAFVAVVVIAVVVVVVVAAVISAVVVVFVAAVISVVAVAAEPVVGILGNCTQDGWTVGWWGPAASAAVPVAKTPEHFDRKDRLSRFDWPPDTRIVLSTQPNKNNNYSPFAVYR